MTEFADVRRTRSRIRLVAERLARQPMTVVEAARNRVRADVPDIPLLGVEHRQLRFLRRADAALRVEHDDARVRHAVKRMGDGAAGVARGGRQDGQRLIARVERRHEPRHRARADVFERQRRTVKQFERTDARFDLDERDREVQCLDDGGLESGRVELAARVRTKHAVRDLGQRARREPLELALRPLVDRFGNIEPAPRRKPLDERLAQRDRGRRMARVYEAHG